MSLSDRIAQYVAETTYDSLPQDVRDMVISCVYNYIGCAYAGVLEPELRR